jgi:hypothetical protein
VNENPQTLLWIGSRVGTTFETAYQYAESIACQLAYRTNINEALERQASNVTHVILSQIDRTPINPAKLQQLNERYPDASKLALQGSLCSGATIRDKVAGLPRHLSFDQWNLWLPIFLGATGSTQDRTCSERFADHTPTVALAVVSLDTEATDTLLDVAEMVGVTAIGLSSFTHPRVRKLDVVWWDDSVASPTDSLSWHQRLRAFGLRNPMPRHVWLTNRVALSAFQTATDAGVSTILVKPYPVDALVASLTSKTYRSVLRFADIPRHAA